MLGAGGTHDAHQPEGGRLFWRQMWKLTDRNDYHYLTADVETAVEDFCFREQIQTVIKPRFYPRLCQFLMKFIPVIN